MGCGDGRGLGAEGFAAAQLRGEPRAEDAARGAQAVREGARGNHAAENSVQRPAGEHLLTFHDKLTIWEIDRFP